MPTSGYTTITLELDGDLVRSVKINGEEATEPSKKDIDRVFGKDGSGVRYISTIASSVDATTGTCCRWVWLPPNGPWVWRCYPC
jgi:hypothetical protein